MTGRAHLIIHPAIERDLDALGAARELGLGFTEMPERPEPGWLSALEKSILATDERPLVFPSLPVANTILRFHPGLARGLSLPKDFLKPSCYAAYLPEEMLLNPRSVFLPWGHLPRMASALASLFPEGLFLRPDCAMKGFTGFATSHEDLQSELSSIGQIHALQPEEMVQVSPRKAVAEIEYRVWMVDSQPVASAAYGWRDLATSERVVPPAIMERAAELGQRLWMRKQEYTADFVLEDGVPKLVEINALSTSGWYRGLDIRALLASCDEVFL